LKSFFRTNRGARSVPEQQAQPAAQAGTLKRFRGNAPQARGEDRPDSDVDLLVDLPPHMGLLGLGRVQADLEAILGAKVDLVPASDLKPAVRARAERDLVAL
jgi:predicted nucleotidyltransferase